MALPAPASPEAFGKTPMSPLLVIGSAALRRMGFRNMQKTRRARIIID